MSLSTHVLDTTRGLPAAEVAVRLDRYHDDRWEQLAEATTGADGRLGDLPAGEPGTYRLRFGTGPYFGARGVETFYPEVNVVFTVTDASAHYHVPLLVNPYGYTTYRGS